MPDIVCSAKGKLQELMNLAILKKKITNFVTSVGNLYDWLKPVSLGKAVSCTVLLLDK